MRSRIVRAFVAASAVAAAAASTTNSAASARDLAELQSEAQAIGEDVSALEHRLAGLNDKRAVLEEQISDAGREIALLDLEQREAELAYEDALAEFVSTAVELYKSGPSPHLDLLLSSNTMSEAFTIAEATDRYSEDATRNLDALLERQRAAEDAQAEIDTHKQTLLAAHAELTGITDEIESTLADRRDVLARLRSRIVELERQARLAAAQAAQPTDALTRLLGPAGPSAGIPDGFVGTGIAFEGIASWYGPGFEGNPTANGDIFDPHLFTAASKELPFGTWLYVEYEGRGVVVVINDRGPYIDGRILDLSQAAAEAIGMSGIGWVRAEILIRA